MWGSGVYSCGSVYRPSFTAAWSPHEYEVGIRSGFKNTMLVTQTSIMRKSVAYQTNNLLFCIFEITVARSYYLLSVMLVIEINVKLRPSYNYLYWLTASRIRWAKKPTVQAVMPSAHPVDRHMTHVVLFMSQITFRCKGIFNTVWWMFETK
jgi:hypothetical protein